MKITSGHDSTGTRTILLVQTRVKKRHESGSRAVSDNSSVVKQPGDPVTTFTDNRPEAEQTEKLQQIADDSPQAAKAARLQAEIDSSPRMVTQRQRMNRVFGNTAQIDEGPEEGRQLRAGSSQYQRELAAGDNLSAQRKSITIETSVQLVNGDGAPGTGFMEENVQDGFRTHAWAVAWRDNPFGVMADQPAVHSSTASHAEVAAIPYMDELVRLGARNIQLDITRSPCTRTARSTVAPTGPGCAEALIAWKQQNQNVNLVVLADHLYGSSTLERVASILAIDAMRQVGINALLATPWWDSARAVVTSRDPAAFQRLIAAGVFSDDFVRARTALGIRTR